MERFLSTQSCRAAPRWKRTIDVVGSLGALVVLSPLIVGISVLILLAMGRPVFFQQRRAGVDNRPFTLLKFRTMRENQRNFGDDEARLTRVGNFLRRFSLDELPQFWNVLQGDMSLVGPRPLLPEYFQIYSAEQARRLDVLPGITGWSQVNGRNAVEWNRRLQMDVWYVDHMSLRLDVKIMLLTVFKAFLGREARPATLLPGSEHLFDQSDGVPRRRAG